MRKRFSRETYPSAADQLRKNAKFQSYIKQLAGIIRAYEKREALGDPYPHQMDAPEYKLAVTVYELGAAQNTEGKAEWSNWDKDILSGTMHEFGINDKTQFRRIMMYFGELAVDDPKAMQQLVHSELQKNL